MFLANRHKAGEEGYLMKIRIFQNNVQGFLCMVQRTWLFLISQTEEGKKKSKDIDLRPAAHT